jgi:hypothetical protein
MLSLTVLVQPYFIILPGSTYTVVHVVIYFDFQKPLSTRNKWVDGCMKQYYVLLN